MKFELNKTWHLLLCLAGGFIAISILAFLFIAFMYRINDIWLFAWIIPNGAEGETSTATPTNSAETLRNFAWLFWMFLSLSGAGLGLWLAWQGRQIHRDQWKTQHESHLQRRHESLQERFEKASDMLGSNVELTRISGCRALMNLGKSDDSMKSQCVQLLFAFINNPYLEDDDKGKDLDELFPPNKALRSDIIEAMVSFSNIYKHYSEVGVDDEVVRLPSYFWKSKGRGQISLIKASLRWANLTDANLRMADLRGSIFIMISLQEANLYAANLQEADLRWTNLQGANLNEAKLQSADLNEANLQKADLIKADLQKVRLWSANLQGADLSGANLWEADLLGANLREAKVSGAYLNGVTLGHADLQGAKLEGTTISNAKMQTTKNLTKEQILSAKWGYNRHGEGGPPKLPKEFMQDEDIKKWLEKPTENISILEKILRDSR